MMTYEELKNSIEEDVFTFFNIPKEPYNQPAIHLKKRINDYLTFKLKWLYKKENPNAIEDINKLKQAFHDEYLNMLEEYCLSFLNIFEQEHQIPLNQQANSELAKAILKFDTGITPLINISVISSLLLNQSTTLAKYCTNKLEEKRTTFDQELTTILNTFKTRSYYETIKEDLTTYKDQTLNNIMDQVKTLGNVLLPLEQTKDKINYSDIIKNYQFNIKKMFLDIEDILDNKLFLIAKINILYNNKIINTEIYNILNEKIENINNFKTYKEFNDTLIKISPRMYNMYKKKILAKVKSEDLIFESDNIEEYFKIFDEYAKDDIDKSNFIMDYLTRINLNEPANLIIITIKNFDIINLKNHKF